ncbi:unnamed protein product [Rhizoctonia solani]|uniref:MYND-type domain-containing protein n=1 Tax=Rhizoctonia solani TaxID=456999 RepID=A0A8H3HHZ8_9AGAM|nr:unnamed protein product [Rhizoctonia solani]
MALRAQFGWGRPLEQYFGSYSQEEVEKWPSKLDKQQLRYTREAIERICEVDLGSATARNHVEISDLETILRSSHSADAYPYFATSGLVRGCIHLMSNVPLSREERQSLNTDIFALEWKVVSSKMMDDMNTNPDTDPIRYFSRRVMVVVIDLIDHSGGLDHDSYNCIIGWSRCSECDDEEELVTRADCSTLLGMLWADSKQFLKALLWTYSPGISSVVYLLWRYACYERYLKDLPSPDRYMIPFVDIYWRCVLSATPDQTLALSFLRKVNFHPAEIWGDMPIKPKLNDTKLPECIEFLPSLFGASINRMWAAFLKTEMKHEVSAIIFRATLEWFCGYLGDLNKPGVNEPIKAQTLIQILKNDLVELIGHVMLYLNPTPIETKSEHEEGSLNLKLLWECEHIFKTIRLLPPKGALKEYFDACGMSWWKLYWRLDSLSESPDLPPDRTPFYRVCKNVWLGMRPDVGKIPYITCKYARCPAPIIQRGLEYCCGHCVERTYCSVRCQQKDWKAPRGRMMCAHPLL